MINQKFRKLYEKLNPEQRLAVDTIEGPVMVVAGPGTGKTQVLTLRIANILLKTQVNPENILALTFSESASFQMRQRLLEIIGSLAYRVEISTFHSFANSIIQGYPEEFESLISSESITEEEQIQFIEKIIMEEDLKILRPWGEPLFYAKDILSAIGDLKKEGVAPDNLAKALKLQKEKFENIPNLHHEKGQFKGQMKGKYAQELKDMEKLEDFIKIFSAYSNLLLTSKKYDFNDMLIETVKVLKKNKSLLLLQQEKYQYILVDEHQDTNASQNQLIELLASFYETPNLFIVGDEKQAIYRFQGASIENFLYFKKKYPQAVLINLIQNYRSGQIILDAAISFISKNISSNILSEEIRLVATPPKEKEKMNLSGSFFQDEKIKIAALDDYFGEFEFVARKIESLIKQGTDPSEIAVLGRRNFELSELADFLKRKQIPFVIDADLDILADLWVRRLLMIFEAVSDFGSEEKFAKVLNIDVLGIDHIDIFKLLARSKTEKASVFEILEKSKGSFKKINSFYKLFKGWVTLSKNIQLDELFIKVLNESGIRQGFLSSPDRNEILNKFICLFETIKEKIYQNPDYSLGDFLQKLELVKKHNLQIKTKSNTTLKKGVRLFTVHKAKGLEFEYVFILQCIAPRWGTLRKRGDKIKIPWNYLGEKVKAAVEFEAIEDERRLFFVGLTRAKKNVILTYSSLSVDLKEHLPSQFLREIDPNLIENLDTEKFNLEFSVQKDLLFDTPIKNLDKEQESDFLKKLFLEKGLNVSSFDNFLECPWKYFFVNLVSIPATRNKYQLFGTAVHSSLDSLIKKRKIEKDPKGYLLKSLKWNLSQQGLQEKDFKEYLEKGKKALEGFYSNVFINFPDKIQSELNIKGVKISGNLTLNGRIDMLEESQKGEFIVHDFKTGKAKARRDIDGSKPDSRNNYFRQLVFYKVLLDRYKEGLMKTKTGVIDFVEPDKKNHFKSEVFEITEEDTKALLQQLQSVADQISSLSFWSETCGKKGCEWCGLRQVIG